MECHATLFVLWDDETKDEEIRQRKRTTEGGDVKSCSEYKDEDYHLTVLRLGGTSDRIAISLVCLEINLSIETF